MSEKASGKVGVRTMREEIAILAGPRGWGDTRESWLARVCQRVPSVPFRTLKAIWYGEITRQDHWAAIDLRRAAERELQATKDRIAVAVHRMEVLDEDFHGPSITALRELSNGPRREDHGAVAPEVHLGDDPPK